MTGDHAAVPGPGELGKVLDRLDDPILVLDPAARVVALTRSVAGLLGRDERELRGTDFTSWIDQRDRTAFAACRADRDGRGASPVRLRLGSTSPSPVVAHLLWPSRQGDCVVLLEDAAGCEDGGPEAGSRDDGSRDNGSRPRVPVARSRDWLRRRLEGMLAAAGGQRVSVLQLDLDGFRSINDAFGYEVGDAVLREVAARLEGCPDGGITARVGGDEFVVLTHCSTEAEAEQAAQQVLTMLALPIAIADRELVVQVSVGVATGVAGDTRADDLVRQASLATAAAKDEPGRHYVMYRPALQRAAEERARLVTELSAGVDRGELRTVFQPIVGAEAGAVLALETLVRWQHPRRGLLTAAEFVPQAEAVGLIGKIDRWVLRHACAEAASWEGPLGGIPITVNMSALSASPVLRDEVDAALVGSGLDPSRLVVELTETALLERPDCVAEQLLALKTLGVRVALDDFGTGYSSLAYLERLPFDWLKIDGSYSRRVGQDRRAQAILGATLELADALGMTVVVEGIELAAHARLLQMLGIDLFQGYFFSPPVRRDALPDAVRVAGDRAAEIHRLDAVDRQPSAPEEEELLRLLADRLQSRIEREIDRVQRSIAAELHDEPLQALWAADLSLESSRSQAPSLPDQLAVAQQGVRHAMTRLRELMTAMRPTETWRKPLRQRLEALVDLHRRQQPATAFVLRSDDLGDVDDPDVADNAHRIVGEALTNVRKHARASRVTIDVRAVGDAVEVEVADDGVGFDLSRRHGPDASSGYGMTGMYDRAELLGGLLTVQTGPGEGTTVRALLPMRQPMPLQSLPA